METFSEFKDHFYSRVKDFSIFDCQDFNLLKVVLDGLKVNYAGRGKYKAYIFSNEFIYRGYLLLKNKMSAGGYPEISRLKKFSHRKYLIIDPGRYKENSDGGLISSYFYHFYNNLPDHTSIVEASAHPEIFHFDSRRLSDELRYEPLSRDELILRKDLLESFKRIKTSLIFSENELLNIKIAIDLFFKKYREWDRILKILKPENAFFVCHYHKEGALLALKRNGIKGIELQHGLIAPEDIFYMFPPEIRKFREKAMFADEIWVYGEFWKQRLLKGGEYIDNQIKIFGYYLHENNILPARVREKLKDLKGDKKIILITTQDKHPVEIAAYIRFLSKDLLEKKHNYDVWVKPHPAEKKGAFESLSSFENVFILEDNLDYLFKFADKVLSIYSTTLYDACRYKIPAYALFVESCADYVNSIVDSGVATKIYPDQNPVDLGEKAGHVDSSYYFSECHFNMITE
jgi:hypothetical protein